MPSPRFSFHTTPRNRMSIIDLEFFFDSKPDVKNLMKSYKTDMLAIQRAVEELNAANKANDYKMPTLIEYVKELRSK